MTTVVHLLQSSHLPITLFPSRPNDYVQPLLQLGHPDTRILTPVHRQLLPHHLPHITTIFLLCLKHHPSSTILITVMWQSKFSLAPLRATTLSSLLHTNDNQNYITLREYFIHIATSPCSPYLHMHAHTTYDTLLVSLPTHHLCLRVGQL